jgi:hypothetical protein
VEKQAGKRRKRPLGLAAAQQDRIAQAKTGHAEQLVEFREQDLFMNTLGTGGRRDRPKLDMTKRGAQERVAHFGSQSGVH